jgi:hypothetical protein
VDGVEHAALRDGVKQGAEKGDAEVVGGETPVEDGVGFAAFRRAPPQDPGGEDAVEQRLDECGEEEVLTLFALEGDAE